MNSPLIRRMLDIDAIPEGAEDVRLVLEEAWPGWVWVLVVVAACVLTGWSYRRLAGPRLARVALATVRLLLIMLVVVVFCGPGLELHREFVRPDAVVCLVDRSESIGIGDVEVAGGRISRDEQLGRILRGHEAMWSALGETKEVHWLGFAGGTFAISGEKDVRGGVPASMPELVPGGTDVDGALRRALDEAGSVPISGIVLFSDGQSTALVSSSVRRRLAAEAVPVFAVPLGSREPMGDVMVSRVEAPRRAYVRDRIPVTVHLRGSGRVGEGRCRVELIDTLTGRTLDAVDETAGTDEQAVVLLAEPVLAGEATWRVVVEAESGDLLPENNTASVSISLIDRPIRVLYIEGYPRWEYRYLKNLLIREPSVESSIMLLSADAGFAQEGDRPVTRLPRTAEEWGAYDLVILGDVAASFFAPDQLDQLVEQVGDRGVGLLWIGGPRDTPRSWAHTAPAALLPFRGSLSLPPVAEPVNLEPTEAADRLGVLRLDLGGRIGWPEELSDPGFGWSQLQFAQHVEAGNLKPTAEVVARSVQSPGGEAIPLVMNLRYGAGLVTYVATDETWRWRYGRGETLPEQFWLQIVRMLARAALAGSPERAEIEIEPRRAEVGRPVRITLRLVDERLSRAAPAMMDAELELDGRSPPVELRLARLPGAEAVYGGTWIPSAAGEVVVRAVDPALGDEPLRLAFRVEDPQSELREPETDHGRLEQLAAISDGEVLGAEDLARLPELLPNRSVRTVDPLRESIWDTPLVLALLVLVLTLEWIGRRILNLA